MPKTKTKEKLKLPKTFESYKVVRFESEEEWLAARVGKVTGTSHIVAKKGGYLKDYWQLLADKVALPNDGTVIPILPEDDRERGRMLEPELIKMFEKETGKKVDTSLCMWVSTENENMAISPDGFIIEKEVITEAIECKAPNSANYLQIYFEEKEVGALAIPSQFHYQKLQYFVINKALQTLYFLFGNPLIPAIPFFIIEVHREDIEDEVRIYKEQQIEILEDINKKVLLLTKF